MNQSSRPPMPCCHAKNTILHQFLTIEARFVRKGCRGTLKIAILLFSFWRSKLVSCERVVAAHSKSQFYSSFWRSKLVSCERVVAAHSKSQFYFSVFGDRSSFRAKGLSRHTQNRSFTFQFLAIEALFVRKGCRGTLKIAILLRFLAKGLRFVPSRWHCPAP